MSGYLEAMLAAREREEEYVRYLRITRKHPRYYSFSNLPVHCFNKEGFFKEVRLNRFDSNFYLMDEETVHNLSYASGSSCRPREVAVNVTRYNLEFLYFRNRNMYIKVPVYVSRKALKEDVLKYIQSKLNPIFFQRSVS